MFIDSQSAYDGGDKDHGQSFMGQPGSKRKGESRADRGQGDVSGYSQGNNPDPENEQQRRPNQGNQHAGRSSDAFSTFKMEPAGEIVPENRRKSGAASK